MFCKIKYIIDLIILFSITTSCEKAYCPNPKKKILINPISCDQINSWTNKSSGVSDFLTHIHFVDSMIGYIGGYNGQLIKTIDGGNTTQKLKLDTPEDINALFFINTSKGFVGTNERLLQTPSSHLFKTIDGGQTFSSVNIPIPMYFKSIFFIDDNIGFIGGGAYPNSSLLEGKLIKTIDGGITWTEIIIPNLKSIGEIFFLNNNIGFICGSYGQIAKTTDAGNTWLDISPNINVNINISNVLFTDITFTNNYTGYCVGFSRVFYDDNYILKTEDGGLNWKRVDSPISGYMTHDIYVSVIFTDEKKGYISGGNTNNNSGIILKTVDGGNSWTKHNTSTPWLTRISVVDCKNIFIVGNNGTFIRSN